MKKLLVFYFLLFVNGLVFAQVNSDSVASTIIQKNVQEKLDSIQIMNRTKVLTYCINGIALNYRDLKDVISKNTKAYDGFATARNLNTTSTIFAIGGSCVLFYGLMSYIVYDNDMSNRNLGMYQPAFNPSPIFIGLGAIAVSIPLGIASKYQLRKAVDIYNNSIKISTFQTARLNLGVGLNGLGLRMIF